MKEGTFADLEKIAEYAEKTGQVYNQKSKSPYVIKKERGGQYFARFADGSDDFYLYADTRAEAIEEAAGYEKEGLFNKK